MAISWVSEAVLGEGRLMEMAYTASEYAKLKVGETFFAWAKRAACRFNGVFHRKK